MFVFTGSPREVAHTRSGNRTYASGSPRSVTHDDSTTSAKVRDSTTGAVEATHSTRKGAGSRGMMHGNKHRYGHYALMMIAAETKYVGFAREPIPISKQRKRYGTTEAKARFPWLGLGSNSVRMNPAASGITKTQNKKKSRPSVSLFRPPKSHKNNN